jgi:hypothetical protein
MNRVYSLAAFSAVIASISAGVAHASCGSAFCTLMTDRYAQGTGVPQIGWSVDLHLESVVQDQLRKGTSRINPSDVTNEDAIERKTDNLNFIGYLSYGFNADWSLALRIPVTSRDHTHDALDEDTGEFTDHERWNFTRLSDIQVLIRRQFLAEGAKTSYAFFGGLKLPTGSFDVVNADGARAERALQPGTGTTDVVIGAAARHAVGFKDALISQISVSEALNSRDEFKPGTRFEISGGWSHAFSHRVGAVIQANLLVKDHDKGLEAEPNNSGLTSLNISPGITAGVGKSSTVYGYVQVPVYQRVNGIQLTPEYAISVGWTTDF